MKLRFAVIDAPSDHNIEGFPVCLHGKRVGQVIAELIEPDTTGHTRMQDPRLVDAEDRRTKKP